MPLPLSPGLLLNDRYLVRHILGQGGFGRTYLAQDAHRFNESCVLKEFAPQLHQPDLLRKARELFEREAGILYQLQHPQIPEFRALLTVTIQGEQSLFLVEQFVPGESYAQQADRGLRLSEAEALQFLRDLMPVLDYIHSRGVIHRDIAPDNLICSNGKPVLIDFGSVRQVATTAMKLLGSGPVLTQIHKLGYTPPEQFRGEVHPSSDFYALAVTVLVLMTGRSPEEFYDEQRQDWRWRSMLSVSPGLGDLLDRMLATFPQNRYPTAALVMQALAALPGAGALPGVLPAGTPIAPLTPGRSPVVPPVSAPRVSPSLSNIKTVAVAPARPVVKAQAPKQSLPFKIQPSPVLVPLPPRQSEFLLEEPKSLGPIQGILRGIGWLLWLPFRLVGWLFKVLWGGVKVVDWVMTWVWRMLLLAALGLAIAFGAGALGHLSLPKLDLGFLDLGGGDSAGKAQSCEEIVARHRSLNIPSGQFYRKVNQRLYDSHPELKGRALSKDAQDAPLRDEWCGLADKMLDSHAKGRSPF
jgi:serine/threonine protein kinase